MACATCPQMYVGSASVVSLSAAEGREWRYPLTPFFVPIDELRSVRAAEPRACSYSAADKSCVGFPEPNDQPVMSTSVMQL